MNFKRNSVAVLTASNNFEKQMEFEPQTWYDIDIVSGLFFIRKEQKIMSEKRRDNKNRVLRNGESQRSDGRYAYKYIDTDGKQQFVYSWKLEKTDKLPKGKRDDLSLREKEKQIQKDLEDAISTSGGNITVWALVEKYISQRRGDAPFHEGRLQDSSEYPCQRGFWKEADQGCAAV